MKALFVTYAQAYNQEITDILNECGQRGYTKWVDVHGVGSVDGEPKIDSHAWPRMNDAIISFVDDGKVDELLARLKARDEKAPELGLRAFVWNVENCI